MRQVLTFKSYSTMTRFDNIEVYSFEDDVWYRTPDNKHLKLTEADRDFVSHIIRKIQEFYPKAYERLNHIYSRCSSNLPYYQYKIVWRFCKCNFGNIDNINDLSCYGRMNFEHVACPLRGECSSEGVICHPEFNSKISDAEMRVLKMVYDGFSNDEISDMLCLSVHTVKNHIRNAYNRIGIHEKAEFIKYAKDNKLWQE